MSSENRNGSFFRRFFDIVLELGPKPPDLDDDLAFWLNSLGTKGKKKSLQRHYLVFAEMFKGYLAGARDGINLAKSITDAAANYTPITGEFVRNEVYGNGEDTITEHFKRQVSKELRFAKEKVLPGDSSLLVRWMAVFCIKELINASNQSDTPDQTLSYRFIARRVLFIGAEESSRLSGIKINGAFTNRVARAILSQETPDLMDDLNKFLTAPPTR